MLSAVRLVWNVYANALLAVVTEEATSRRIVMEYRPLDYQESIGKLACFSSVFDRCTGPARGKRNGDGDGSGGAIVNSSFAASQPNGRETSRCGHHVSFILKPTEPV
ncbi:hypothetical protein [Allomesorhizobium alhagi]|uniref:hypothetical protein n=1 Tax=Allomesorhizobium alhagi TaxID=475067 RepID=UPI001111B9D6|nr:hypothetical protein [Mesorhizobium alhagi]